MFEKLEKILNEAFDKKYNVKSLTEAERVSVDLPTFANKESDLNIKSLIKNKQDKVEADKKAEEERKHREELRQKYSKVIDSVKEVLATSSEPHEALQVLFDELVPASGPADTVAGELVRAMMKILYRDWNDGDVFYEGYGIETCGPAVSYIVDNIDGMFDKFDNIAKAELPGNTYTDEIENIAKEIVNHIIENPELLETPRDREMYDYEIDWIYRDWEPKYEYDVSIDSDIKDHIDAGHIDYRDVYDFIDQCISYDNELNGAEAYQYGYGDFVIQDLTRAGFDVLESYFEGWMQDWADELNEEYPFDEDEENDEELDESCKSHKKKKPIKESFNINTIADFFEFNDYTDMDVYDEDWDYGTAIVWEGEQPRDGYDRFIDWLVKHLEFVSMVDSTTVIARYSKLVDTYKDAFEKFCNENNRGGYTYDEYDDDQDKEEVGILTMLSMIEGNYSDRDYDEFLKLVR